MASRLNRITKTIKQRVFYRDFKINFDLLPITGQLELVENEQAVIQALRNLVLIYPTEIHYHPTIGSLISRSLFEGTDEFTLQQIQDTVVRTIQNNEPRVTNLQVNVVPVPQQNFVTVNIQFSLAVNPTQVYYVPAIPLRVR